jgi:hypothetical protein
VRPTGDRTSGNGNPVIANAGAGEFAQCSPRGRGHRVESATRTTGNSPAPRVSFSLVTDDLKVHENEVFIDVEGHQYWAERSSAPAFHCGSHAQRYVHARVALPVRRRSATSRTRGRKLVGRPDGCWTMPTTSATTISSGLGFG